MDSKPNDCNAIASFYGVSGRNLQYQYKEFLSNFKAWDQLKHAEKWLLFPQNIGKRLSIDETSLSNGELYTVVTNKAAKGRKGTIVAMIAGTKAETVISFIEQIPIKQRKQVKEITLDMAANMGLIAKKCFPNAIQVTDRFHVQKLALDALQEIRIKYRWQAIDLENEAIEKAKSSKIKYESQMLSNGDTNKQLLARSRHFLNKNKSKWSKSQIIRAILLFDLYPEIQKAYELAQDLRNIFENTQNKIIGLSRLAKWHEKVNQSGFKSFNTISRSIENHYQTILNYFDNRSTNASAESFNAKIKAFRSQFRGVRNIGFFLFRLTNIYA
ncbi:ISAon1 family transposase [Flavobacterium gilvum]|uniref:DDE transposase n=1 Tax=Flavobacterium gilvum TaxID=1492737 RepID=A0AAC9I4H5_9FLAO|nr:DDE transposase [Flavobacterium gilvum]AOW10234.1 DDE transposase [Flavobacterium gilvum]